MIDVRSDTATLPNSEMLDAILKAKLGDEILGEDPTVARLENLAADILGKEAAIFTCSGTMSNQIAVMALTKRGDEIIVGEKSHLYNLEAGGLAALSQVQVRTISCPKGYMDPDLIKVNIMPRQVQYAKTGLICLENTYDLNYGYPVTAENTREVCNIARDYGIPVYLDGARIFNAAVSLKIDVKELVREVDAVQVCLTKGLGAPFGSVLAGNRMFIDECKHLKQRIGGGLRQAGIVAAPGIVALTKMPQRLEEDHVNAQILANGIKEIDSTLLNLDDVVTNAIVLDVSETSISSDDFRLGLLQNGVKVKQIGSSKFRIMTHLNIGQEEIRYILESIRKVFNSKK